MSQPVTTSQDVTKLQSTVNGKPFEFHFLQGSTVQDIYSAVKELEGIVVNSIMARAFPAAAPPAQAEQPEAPVATPTEPVASA